MLVYSRNRKSLRLNQRGEKVDFWKFDVLILVFLMMIILRLLCNCVGMMMMMIYDDHTELAVQ